ncbi:heavy-metal-associated domain-containing protein [Candidatus Uhrbacteria bacterium]|nr:heavy-metal-associated domain-containing protein [Candidatus Uhrbacteria bacterium]
MTTITFKVTGMHCSSCKNLIEDVARDVPGVKKAIVNPEAAILTIEHGDVFDTAAFARMLRELGAGYEIQSI